MQQRLKQLKEKRLHSNDDCQVKSESQFKASTLKNQSVAKIMNEAELLARRELQQEK